MPVAASVRASLYQDSVALMRIAQIVQARPGVRQATLLMGTPANKAMLDEAGLLLPELDAARPGDLMIVIAAETDAALAAAADECRRLLEGAPGRKDETAPTTRAPRSIAMASAPESTLAQISVPGAYAGAEAMKALRRGLHVFLFSDNVPIAQELAIKTLARERRLLVMGPDCGTAILGGTPIGFANAVRRGAVGLVGASGTGLQEVACQIHARGQGVSHALGTGGRDVSEAIGGITMHAALDALASDPGTRVIVAVSKPPAASVARSIVTRARAIDKPVVLLFLGADIATHERLPAQIVAVDTLRDAAIAAVTLLEGRSFADATAAPDALRAAQAEARRLAPGQRYLRGLYSGGTFCSEAQLVWRALGLDVHSNAPVDGKVARGEEAHVALDLGSDEYTVGRPHPMIDPGVRIARIADAARDPATAAIVLDVVLGFGSHPDPAGALAPAILQARSAATRDGRHLAVVGFVTGTEEDPQRLSVQQAALRGAGAIVAASSTDAAAIAGEIARDVQSRTSRSLAAHG